MIEVNEGCPFRAAFFIALQVKQAINKFAQNIAILHGAFNAFGAAISTVK
jgi:hypothetical protein